MNRFEILERVRQRPEPWDIIVIGGGATGVGCAVDAASRGFDVLLLEQHDFGKGTSSRSTKLVHGGVRYLEQGNISLVREALTERGILLRNAPHVVHKQAFIVPCYSLWQKFYYGVGLKIYDLLSGKDRLGKSQILSKGETIKQLPTISSDGLSGGILYYDGQFDDTRLLIDLLTTAHDQGASVLNYARVATFVKNADGKVGGVNFEDVLSGEQFTVKAKAVINATGAYCDGVRRLSDSTAKPIVTLSQGIHLVLDRTFLPGNTALLIPKTSDGRVLFCIPWHGHTLVGTTDTQIETANLEPKALESEIEFVLKTAGDYLAKAPSRSDILSVFAGIRPLVKSNFAKNTASLSRGHAIEIDAAGMLTITGGKWTTYRSMAEDAVDQAIRLARLEFRRSVTAELQIECSYRSGDKQSDKLHSDLPYTRVDVLRAVNQEMALSVEDVLARRTRALFLNASAAIELAPKVAEIMAGELGENQDWITKQTEEFQEVAKNYKAS